MYSIHSINTKEPEIIIPSHSPKSSSNKPPIAEIYLDDPLYNRKEAAFYISPPERRPYSPGTLAVWDCTKQYDLRPEKIGRFVYYRKSSLDRFLRERLKP